MMLSTVDSKLNAEKSDLNDSNAGFVMLSTEDGILYAL